MTGQRRNRRKVPALAVLIAAAVGLAGCWDRTEVNDLALIMGAGLDLTEDGKLELSAQVYIAKQSGEDQQNGASDSDNGASGGTGKDQTVVYTATGDTMADAATKLQELLPRKVFWGHDEVFVFGEQMAKHGITDQTDFLLRHPGPRLGAYVFVSRGPALDVMEQPSMLERNISESLREMAKAQTGLKVTVKDLLQTLEGDTGAAALPLIVLRPKKQGAAPSPYISGSAVLKHGKLVGQIDEYTTRGVMWLQDRINESAVTFRPYGTQGFVSAQLVGSSTQLIPSVKGDDWKIQVRVTAQANLVQNESGLNPLEPAQVQRIEEGLNDEVTDRISHSLEQIQRKMRADVFGFANVFRRRYPKQWKRAEADWNEQFPQVKVSVCSDIRLERPGFSGK